MLRTHVAKISSDYRHVASRVTLGLLAFLSVTSSVLGLVLGESLLAALIQVFTATALVFHIAFDVIWSKRQSLVDEAVQLADRGRKLAIYERGTGAFAYWYVLMRWTEESSRAVRYGRTLTLALVEPEAEGDASRLTTALAAWLQEHLRVSDIVGYLGYARFVVVMPETDQMGARIVMDRLLQDVAGGDVGVVSFPEDGLDFEQLCTEASRRLQKSKPRAA